MALPEPPGPAEPLQPTRPRRLPGILPLQRRLLLSVAPTPPSWVLLVFFLCFPPPYPRALLPSIAPYPTDSCCQSAAPHLPQHASNTRQRREGGKEKKQARGKKTKKHHHHQQKNPNKLTNLSWRSGCDSVYPAGGGRRGAAVPARCSEPGPGEDARPPGVRTGASRLNAAGSAAGAAGQRRGGRAGPPPAQLSPACAREPSPQAAPSSAAVAPQPRGTGAFGGPAAPRGGRAAGGAGTPRQPCRNQQGRREKAPSLPSLLPPRALPSLPGRWGSSAASGLAAAGASGGGGGSSSSAPPRAPSPPSSSPAPPAPACAGSRECGQRGRAALEPRRHPGEGGGAPKAPKSVVKGQGEWSLGCPPRLLHLLSLFSLQ